MLEMLARRYSSPPLARMAKRVLVYPRYLYQQQACQLGYLRYRELYTQKILFIAGLPKSGTTWLKRMLSGYPGFHELLIPEVTAYEMATGGSHDYELPNNIFARLQRMLVVTKMHVHGSPHNIRLLCEAGVKHVVLYRDLRDVAVSHYFYVRQTPWHPEYPIYARLALPEALVTFARRTLPSFAQWVRSWLQNRDPVMSLLIGYEELLANTTAVMTVVAEHFELDSSPAVIRQLVAACDFRQLSHGRQPGEANHNSFFRKGIAGDWRNHFTADTKEIYKQLVGDFLIELGYEQDDSW